jgi:enamine deaminase RidA (YjgF/YER057c/UK114 family)
MKTTLISSGSSFEAIAGYSRAVVIEHDGWAEVAISGVTGFDYQAMTIDDDAAAQTRQCFRNIEGVLKQAGAGLEHIVRVRYLLTDPSQWDALAPVFGESLSTVKPAATAVVVQLIDPRMKIEIEVDARVPR